jgi:hypothetical protein
MFQDAKDLLGDVQKTQASSSSSSSSSSRYVFVQWWRPSCIEISFHFHEIWMIAKIMAGLCCTSLFYPTPPHPYSL